MLVVAGIDPLRRVADEEVLLPRHARVPLDHGDADLLGRAGVDRRLEHDDGAALEMLADGFACAQERREIGLVRVVDGRGDGDDDEVGLASAAGSVVTRSPRAARSSSRRHLARGIDTPAIGVDLGGREIEADRGVLLAELDRERKPDVAQADDGDSDVVVHVWISRVDDGPAAARAAVEPRQLRPDSELLQHLLRFRASRRWLGQHSDRLELALRARLVARLEQRLGEVEADIGVLWRKAARHPQ